MNEGAEHKARSSTAFLFVSGLALSLSVATGFSCRRSGSQEGARDESHVASALDGIVGRAVSGLGESHLFSFQPVCNDTDFIQGAACGESWDEENPSLFALNNKYRNPTTDEWDSYVFEYSASFELRKFDSQETNVFFVYGEAANGDGVIEKWQARGAQVGDDSRSTPPLMMRQELYRGTTLGDVRLLGADPNGRFLMLIHGSNPLRLSRMELSGGYRVTQILSAINEPGLEDVSGHHVAQHEAEGRIWVFEGPELRTILYDYENDGVFESWVSVDDAGWQSLGYEGPVWTDDFVNVFWWE